MRHIAIIPARGGSKRIPRKNILPFRGRPMIGWTIKAALESDVFDKVLVSTDCSEIAEIAIAEGAEVPFLREEHADDQSVVSEAVASAVNQAMQHYNENFDFVTQLMPNCPLRGVQEIQHAWRFFQEGAHKFQISAFEYGWMNPWWAAKMSADGKPEWMFPEERLSRSQDLEKLYCPTGAIWIAETTAFMSARTFYGTGHVLCPMDWEAAIDIDDEKDLRMAQAVAGLG